MNESETRAEYIDVSHKASGWGEVEGSKIFREFRITDGKIQTGGTRGKPEIIDYVLQYKNRKIGTLEAKSIDFSATEGKEQAVSAAKKFQIDYAFSSNGKGIYQIEMKTGDEKVIEKFPTPDELWNNTFADWNEWKEKLARLADVSNNTIVNIEAGKQKNPTIETLRKIAKALGVQVDNLIK